MIIGCIHWIERWNDYSNYKKDVITIHNNKPRYVMDTFFLLIFYKKQLCKKLSLHWEAGFGNKNYSVTYTCVDFQKYSKTALRKKLFVIKLLPYITKYTLHRIVILRISRSFFQWFLKCHLKYGCIQVFYNRDYNQLNIP